MLGTIAIHGKLYAACSSSCARGKWPTCGWQGIVSVDLLRNTEKIRHTKVHVGIEFLQAAEAIGMLRT